MSFDSVLTVENLSKTIYKRSFFKKEVKEILKGISFSMGREIFGFIGPNGAGKTTTIKSIMNFIKPTSGRILVFDSEIDNVKQRIGFLPERPFIYPTLKAKEYLHFCADTFSVPYFERKKLFSSLLAMVDLIGVEEMPVSSLSKGMLQRLLFASILIGDPDLLILDEPMSGLDPIGRSIIFSVLKDLRKNKGKAVFFSSHIIQDVERLSDRVAIIVNGEIRLCASVPELISKYVKGYIITYKASGKILSQEVSVELFWKEMEKLKASNVQIISVEPARASLEDIFVNIVRGSKSGGDK